MLELMKGEPTTRTTVVVPVWDTYVVGRLPEALDSLLAQGVPVRVLVVDNASQVEVPVLPGVTVLRSERRLSLGAARNLGLEAARTPYVVMWDADDVMLPGTLAFLERALEADPRLAAFAMAIIEHPAGHRHRWPRRWVATLVRVPRLFALADCVWSLYPTTGSTIMRTALVRSAGCYGDSDSGEDWCLGASLALEGRIGWTERPGRLYRLHPGSVSAHQMTIRDQRRNARAVRQRLRSSPATPGWIRRVLPLIQLGQHAALVAHVVATAGRRTRSRIDERRRPAPGTSDGKSAPQHVSDVIDGDALIPGDACDPIE
jgi:glycosyltransferase involved in cell wall biosynthesis